MAASGRPFERRDVLGDEDVRLLVATPAALHEPHEDPAHDGIDVVAAGPGGQLSLQPLDDGGDGLRSAVVAALSDRTQ